MQCTADSSCATLLFRQVNHCRAAVRAGLGGLSPGEPVDRKWRRTWRNLGSERWQGKEGRGGGMEERGGTDKASN